jgi:hypothetical protein
MRSVSASVRGGTGCDQKRPASAQRPRAAPCGPVVSAFATGLNNPRGLTDFEPDGTWVEKVLGLAFGGDKLYALEMSTSAGGPTLGTGAIVRVRRHGPPVTIVSGLTFPTGMTVGPDGAFYVSNQGFGFGEGQGQILRIEP